jgi:hypothetical protein
MRVGDDIAALMGLESTEGGEEADEAGSLIVLVTLINVAEAELEVEVMKDEGPATGLFPIRSLPLKASNNRVNSRGRGKEYGKSVTPHQLCKDIQNPKSASQHNSDIHLPTDRLNRSKIEHQCHTAEGTHPGVFGLLEMFAVPLFPSEACTTVVARGLSNTEAFA